MTGVQTCALPISVRIQLASNNERHASISQHAHRVDDIGHKHKLLSHYASNESLSQALIFTATKRNADRLSKRLMADGHASAALHGDMSQNKRKRTVENMRRGKIRLLVATDVAARGLDIRGISHVINFDMPMVAEDYIHRIGRTGRAGAKGTAISLVGPDDRHKLSSIQRLIGSDLNWAVIQGLEPTSPEPRRGHPRPAKGKGPHNNKAGYGKKRGGQQQSRTRSQDNKPNHKSGQRKRKFGDKAKTHYRSQPALG